MIIHKRVKAWLDKFKLGIIFEYNESPFRGIIFTVLSEEKRKFIGDYGEVQYQVFAKTSNRRIPEDYFSVFSKTWNEKTIIFLNNDNT